MVNSESISLRRAHSADVQILYELRNEKIARAMSLQTDPIDYHRHQIWFEDTLNNSSVNIFIAEFAEGPVGYSRLSMFDSCEAEISIATDYKYRGKGFGGQILSLTISEVNSLELGIKKLVAVIKKENLRSIRLFEKFGFKQSEQSDRPDVFKYELVL